MSWNAAELGCGRFSCHFSLCSLRIWHFVLVFVQRCVCILVDSCTYTKKEEACQKSCRHRSCENSTCNTTMNYVATLKENRKIALQEMWCNRALSTPFVYIWRHWIQRFSTTTYLVILVYTFFIALGCWAWW